MSAPVRNLVPRKQRSESFDKKADVLEAEMIQHQRRQGIDLLTLAGRWGKPVEEIARTCGEDPTNTLLVGVSRDELSRVLDLIVQAAGDAAELIGGLRGETYEAELMRAHSILERGADRG